MTLFYLLTGSSASLQSIRSFPVWTNEKRGA
jgi:hypothetical protein